MIQENTRMRIIEALKANPNANAVAREIGGVSRGTVRNIAKKANIDVVLMPRAVKGQRFGGRKKGTPNKMPPPQAP
jgi:hypothetical protein